MTPEQLKASILQYAIQGKLVPQDPSEGTGEDIFKRLEPYHKGIKPCKDELNFSSMDFDIPESWTMVELNQIFNFVDYRGKTPTKITSGVFLITASNIRQGYMDYTRKEYISFEEYQNRQSRGLTQKGDLLFTTEAPLGNAALCDLDECSCGQRIITLKEYTKDVTLPALFMYFILSPQFQQQLIDNCTGTTAKGIKAEKLKHFLLPLPPYREQKRIVARINELLPYVDRYAAAYGKLEQFNARFPEDMKKSVLQYAIQGKLVPQNPSEGTGEELYQQIQKEKQRLIKEGKIKKEKPLPEITEDEIPFDIPESWKWVRFGEVYSLSNGIASRGTKGGTSRPVLRLADLSDGIVNVGNIRSIELSEKEFQSHRVEKDDLIFIRVNGTKARVATAFHYKGDEPISYCDHLFCGNKVSEGIFADYIMHVFNAAFTRKQLLPEIKTTAGQNTISQASMAKVLLPLPPLSEQRRIVAKLEKILPLCDRLK